MFRAAVPSGASTGIYEALEMRDKGKDYHGKGTYYTHTLHTHTTHTHYTHGWQGNI